MKITRESFSYAEVKETDILTKCMEISTLHADLTQARLQLQSMVKGIDTGITTSEEVTMYVNRVVSAHLSKFLQMP